MEQKSMYIGIAVGIIIVLGILYVFWPRASVSTVVLNFGGMPIYLRPVEGHDVPCMGAPDGYIMVHFADESDESEISYTVGYAREGDHYEEALSWAKSRASACGFQKIEETSLAVPGAHGTSLDYRKGGEDIYIDVGAVTGSDGKMYTVMRVTYVAPRSGSGTSIVAEETTGSGTSEEGAETQEEVQVSGMLKTWDDEIRSVLSSVFGSITLTSAMQIPTSGAYGFEYMTPRPVSSADAQKLVDAFTSKGWQQMTLETTTDHISLGFQKDNAFLGLDADVGGDTISVVIYGG